jgi:hypothetical protein
MGEVRPGELDKYREWRSWAVRHMADTIITQGFRGIDGAIDRVIVQYLNLPHVIRMTTKCAAKRGRSKKGG